MQIELISLFPEMFMPVFELGVLGKAVQNGFISIHYTNPRDFAHDRHHTVDDRPYGGGPGMLMKVQPLQDAITSAKQRIGPDKKCRTIYLSPQGARLEHGKVQELARSEALILVSGRYEGVDQRLIDAEIDEEISIGDYVLSGGELASMVLVDAVARLIPGVLGHADSAEEDSFVNGLLDHPHYTRPEEFNGQSVPSVLLSGDHEKIRRWRLKQSLGKTWLQRPELLKNKSLNVEQQQLLQEFIEEANR